MPAAFPWRLVGALAGIVAIIVAVSLTLRTCQQNRSLKTQTRVTTGQVGAATSSGSVAVNTVGGVMTNDAGTDAAVAQGQGAIHAAAEGQKGKVSQKVACGFKSAADRPECKGGQ